MAEVPVEGYDLIIPSEESILLCAKITYEVNKVYCSLTDEETLPWEAVGESVIQGVKSKLANPGMTPEESHESWLRYKRAAGWKLGPEKDAQLKQHPCMVPYEELPKFQQVKDHIFQAVVEAFFGL